MKKEIRVNNVARRLLTDEELEQVAGGASQKQSQKRQKRQNWKKLKK